MTTAREIVDVLLETDEPDDADSSANPEAYLHGIADQHDQDYKAGKITPQTALLAGHFWHRTATTKDGIRAIQCRRNGKTQTWKTRPNEFKIPCKYGMYDFFYITDKNAADWSIQPIPDKPKPAKVKKPKPVVNPSSLMPPL